MKRIPDKWSGVVYSKPIFAPANAEPQSTQANIASSFTFIYDCATSYMYLFTNALTLAVYSSLLSVYDTA